MIQRVTGFEDWRRAARACLGRGLAPEEIQWQPAEDGRLFLFEEHADVSAEAVAIRLPKAFLPLAATVARHRQPERWSLLYRTAWRLVHENRNLLEIEIDPDVRALSLLKKDVDRDIYKMRAFVRFRQVSSDGGEQYIAWYRPDHRTLDANEQFFARRFGGMRWAILTPEESMYWDIDAQKVHFGPGVPRSEAPAEDEFEDLWRAYYASIYNPARLNLDAMRAQLPMRRWVDLPESRMIPELVRQSPGRLDSMTEGAARSASEFIPRPAGLPVLRNAIRQCEACELCSRATQPVAGEGPEQARILLAGEQPGDDEDRAGRPFVGPAGRVLDSALQLAGIDRRSVFLTNAVKAFRFEERGKRRIHQTPRPLHISTCRPWLEAEIEAVQPEVIVCLGATAAQSVLGRTVKIGEERGRTLRHASGARVVVTYHPSAILRAPDESRARMLELALVEDLQSAR